MSEGLFILTTIFVAYVVYVIVGDSKAEKSARTPAKKRTAPPRRTAAKPAARASAAKTTSTSTAARKPASKPPAKSAVADNSAVTDLRNPETGEVAAIASNYRFMKRWIKDALVTEGLLDKVYKNNDLNDAAETKIKAALAKIKAMDKYKA